MIGYSRYDLGPYDLWPEIEEEEEIQEEVYYEPSDFE